MASTLKSLWGPVQPGTVDATRYTVPAATTGLIREIWLTNTTGNDATINLAKNGTAATAANCLVYLLTVPAGKTIKVKGFMPFSATDTLHDLQGTANAITSTGFGVELT